MNDQYRLFRNCYVRSYIFMTKEFQKNMLDVSTQREIIFGCGNRKNAVNYNVVVIATFNS